LNLTRASLDAILKYKASFADATKAQGPSPEKTKFVYDGDSGLVGFASHHMINPNIECMFVSVVRSDGKTVIVGLNLNNNHRLLPNSLVSKSLQIHVLD
jgi:hypothetical protein